MYVPFLSTLKITALSQAPPVRPFRGVCPSVFCILWPSWCHALAHLTLCSIHPSIPLDAGRPTGLPCCAGRAARERRGCKSSPAAWIYRDCPPGFLFASGTAPRSHSTETGCYYEAGGLREAGSWRDPSPLPHGRRSPHTHGHDQLASLRVGPSSWPRQWGCGEARAHLFEARIPKMPTKRSPSRLLLPLRWPRWPPARLYIWETYCGMHGMHLHRPQRKTRAAAPPACVRPRHAKLWAGQWFFQELRWAKCFPRCIRLVSCPAL